MVVNMKKISLSDIDFGEEEISRVADVIKSKWISMGPLTKEFEKKFAEYMNVKHAIAISNCTAALHLSNLALGVKPGDEVIVPSLTFVATSNSIIYSGAQPVFADVESKDNFNISPDSIKEKISKKTKGIIIVHYGGYPCDMERIMGIAHDHNLFVIEDAAHAPGAQISGKMLGTIGDIGCFSFFSNKNLVTGEGGMITTNDDKLAEEIRTRRSHAMTSLSWDKYKGHAFSYDVTALGYNYRANEISSALGLCQLKKLDKNNAIRKDLSDLYRKYLEKIKFISVPFKKNNGKPSHHIFPILLDERVDRTKFMEFLKSKGIQTSIHYPLIHLFSYYRNTFGFKEGMLPITEHIGKKEVTLPLHPLLNKEDVKFIADQILKFGETLE
jgi:dTDP-4-amino-4,6-dideoxygalactose transaminase